MEQKVLNEMLITKEDLVVHFTESDDTLDNFIGIVKEAFGEAEVKRNAILLEKFEQFAKENSISLDKVKAFFMPKVEMKVKAGAAKKDKNNTERFLYIYELNGKKFGIMRGAKGVGTNDMELAMKAGQSRAEMKARGEAASEAVKARVGESRTAVDITDLPESE
ncbi:hypothetical protein [Aeromonas salmonicida]